MAIGNLHTIAVQTHKLPCNSRAGAGSQKDLHVGRAGAWQMSAGSCVEHRGCVEEGRGVTVHRGG